MFLFLGTADWHHLRRFSFTSSQAFFAFAKAFQLFYQHSHAWREVAKFLYGQNWRNEMSLQTSALDDDDSADDNASENDADELVNEDDLDSTSPGEKIKKFIQDYQVLDEDHATEAALNAIRPIVLDETIKDATGAADFVKSLTQPVLRAVLNILSELVPESKRHRVPVSSKTIEKDVLKWLKYPNLKREYFFYSSDALKEIITTKKIKMKGTKTIDKMIDALSDPSTETELDLEPKEAAIQAILKRSFLPHQKGKEREACRMGHVLELPVLRKWLTETIKPRYIVQGLQVTGAYTAGLVAKKDSPWAKDSIDFVLAAKSNANPLLQLWGVEIKSRVSPRTISNEVEFVDNTRESKNLKVPAEEAHLYIESPGELFQVLHHAYVYDFENVVFIVGDIHSEILQSTIVDFSNDEILNHYKTVLQDLKDLALGWFYPSNSLPRRLPTDVPEEILQVATTLKNIPDNHSIEGSVNLYLSLIQKKLPMPSFVRLIPAVCAYWNAVKSGSDTTTKLMDDRALYPPHVNAETVACTRLIHLLIVIIHRLFQIISASDINSYPTLYHYCNAASHRFTLFKTLLKIKTILTEKVLNKPNNNSSEKENQHPAKQPTRRTVPFRQRVNGVLPQPMEFGVKLPFQTPKKIKKKVEQSEVCELVSDMYEKCTGRLVQVVDNARRQRCSICDKKTSYYCAGCKSWFCFTTRVASKPKHESQELKLLHYNVKGRREFFHSSCFSEKHQNSWKQEDAKIASLFTP